MIMFYDTETTGLPIMKIRSDDPSQPHLVQLALATYDDAGKEIESESVIIKPDGWEISEEAAAIHGITNERATAEGIPESVAVSMYVAWLGISSLRVAHNEAFDNRIMRIAMMRAGIPREKIEELEAGPRFCTCAAATPVVNLPPTRRMLNCGFTKPKPPKLEECIRHFFDEGLPGAHDALVDVRACARVYFHLMSIREKRPEGVSS